MDGTFVDLLKNELEERSRRNPAYSLRAFAHTLGLKAPHLSDILKGKKGMSLTMAQSVSKRLNLDNEERLLFCDQVLSQHARNPADRAAAKIRVKSKKALSSFHTLEIEEFKMISEWHHFAILHLFELNDFESSESWISERLGLPKPEVSAALQRLEKLNLIDRKHSLWKIKKAFTSVKDIPSSIKKKYQHGVIKKAQDSLDEQSSEERDFSSVVMSVDSAQLSEAKAWIKTFRRKFCADLDMSKNKDSIYCLGIQFFKLTK